MLLTPALIQRQFPSLGLQVWCTPCRPHPAPLALRPALSNTAHACLTLFPWSPCSCGATSTCSPVPRSYAARACRPSDSPPLSPLQVWCHFLSAASRTSQPALARRFFDAGVMELGLVPNAAVYNALLGAIAKAR